AAPLGDRGRIGGGERAAVVEADQLLDGGFDARRRNLLHRGHDLRVQFRRLGGASPLLSNRDEHRHHSKRTPCHPFPELSHGLLAGRKSSATPAAGVRIPPKKEKSQPCY